MGKVRQLVGDDLKAKTMTDSAGRQRGAMPSDTLVPMQFKMPYDFAWQFREEATRRRIKQNELFRRAFHALLKG